MNNGACPCCGQTHQAYGCVTTVANPVERLFMPIGFVGTFDEILHCVALAWCRSMGVDDAKAECVNSPVGEKVFVKYVRCDGDYPSFVFCERYLNTDFIIYNSLGGRPDIRSATYQSGALGAGVSGRNSKYKFEVIEA